VNLSGYCWIGVALYCLVMLWLGYICRVRSPKEEGKPNFEFWIAKRALPGWWLGISLTSGWLMLGWIGFGMAQVYLYGTTGLWILPIPWFILCVIVIWMVPFVRRVGSVSLPIALEKRFGTSVRVVVAVFSIFVFLAWTQAELFMGGTLMADFLHVDPWICMAIIAVPVMIYMYMGGFRASVLTDIAQFVLIAIFMFILTWGAWKTASHAAPGGMMAALSHTTTAKGTAGQTFSLWCNGWFFPVALLIGFLPGWMMEQDLLLRLQGAPSTKEAYRGAWTGFVLIVIFVIALPAFIAYCAIVAFPAVNGAPPDILSSDATKITSAFIANMPSWVQVLMLVGILGCQMSVVDRFSNVVALPFAHDVVDPILRRAGKSEWARLSPARWLSVVSIAASLGLAFMNSKLGDVYNLSSGVLSASVAVPAILIFWKRANTAGVLSGSIVGFFATVGMYYIENKHFSDGNWLPGFLQGAYGNLYVGTGVVASVITLVVVSLLTPAPSAARLAAVKAEPVDDVQVFLHESYETGS
jgi:SSS family solute:Na+ symporter